MEFSKIFWYTEIFDHIATRSTTKFITKKYFRLYKISASYKLNWCDAFFILTIVLQRQKVHYLNRKNGINLVYWKRFRSKSFEQTTRLICNFKLETWNKKDVVTAVLQFPSRFCDCTILHFLRRWKM